MEFKNNCATLTFHNNSLRGRVADYVVKCYKPQVDMFCLIDNTYELFMKLISHYTDAKVRFIVKVNYYAP